MDNQLMCLYAEREGPCHREMTQIEPLVLLRIYSVHSYLPLSSQTLLKGV